MKKLVSLALVFVMVMSLFTIVPFSASAADTKTVYFQNNWMWTDVKVYYWDTNDSALSSAWPGDTPQLVGNDGTYDVYAATVPSNIKGIIFNGYDSGKGGNNQTPDILDSANGDCYYMIWNNQNEVGKAPISDILPDIVTPTSDPTPIPTTPNPNPSGTKTVYFQNNWMWTDIYAYAWMNGADYTAAWPGNPATLVGNDGTYDIYSVTVPTGVEGVIFNGYDSGMGGNNQTPDILDSADGDMYYMIWSDTEGKNDLGKTFYNPVNPTDPDPIPTQPQPTTPQPTTVEPTEEPTQSDDDGLYVVADGEKFAVKKGDVVTYNYYLSVDSSLKISSLDINMFYDTEGLDFVPFTDEYGDADLAKHFPVISGGVVNNFAIDGEIYYNYSSVAGVRLVNNAVIFTGQFKVTADKGTYNINSKMITMADSNMNKIVYAEEVIQPDVYTVETELVGGETPTEPTEGPKPTQPTPTNPTPTQPQPTQTVGDDLYVVADGVKYAVSKGDVVTYRYYLSVDSTLKISSLDINMFYDTEGLDFLPYTDEYGDVDMAKHFPKIFGGCVNNFGIDGEIYYNYSSVAGIRLTNEAVIFEGQFKVTADKGTYNINSKMITLADSDMNKIVYAEEVIQPDVYTVKTELNGVGPLPTDTPKPTETTPVGDGLYVRVDNKDLYEVEKGDTVTYQYILNVPDGTKISSIDMNTFYDTEGLDFVPYTDEYGDDDIAKHFPKIAGGCVHNFGIDGEIYYNYSNVAGIRLTNDAVMFEGQFTVTADSGIFDIDTKLVTLADSDMNKIVYNFEVIQNIYEEKELLVDRDPGPGPDPQYLVGDVNRDGAINIFDVSEIQRDAAEFIDLDEEQMILADTNFDGKVNIFDASEIQRFIAGQITEFTKK